VLAGGYNCWGRLFFEFFLGPHMLSKKTWVMGKLSNKIWVVMHKARLSSNIDNLIPSFDLVVIHQL
jgi:hypothetical protein